MVVAHFVIVSNTHFCKVFVNIIGKWSFISGFWDGKTHLQSQCIIKWCIKGFPITNKSKYPFAIIKIRSSKIFLGLGHFYGRVCENQRRLWRLMEELCFISRPFYKHPHTLLQLPICIVPNQIHVHFPCVSSCCWCHVLGCK